MNKYVKSEKGITLVEILLTLVLVSLITVLITSILTNGLNTAQRVKIEAEIRDEADYLMVQLLNEMYVLKTSEIKSRNLDNPSTPADSYLVIQKTGSSTTHQLGFSDGRILLDSRTVEPSNTEIILSPRSHVSRIRQGHYQVVLALQSTLNNQEIELQTEIQIINDTEVE